MKKTMFFLLSVWVALCSSCTACKNDDCSSGSLQFNVPVQAYGIKDTLQLGDTLRIKLEIPEQLAERNSGNMYDFINYNFKLITCTGSFANSWNQIYNKKIENTGVLPQTARLPISLTPKRQRGL